MPMAQGLAERTPSALKCTSLYMGSGIQHYVVITTEVRRKPTSLTRISSGDVLRRARRRGV